MNDGRKLILLGLSQGNIDRLRKGQPIRIDPEVLLSIKPPDVVGGIMIIYGETEGAIAKLLYEGKMITDETIVHAIPEGSRRGPS